jgi:multidrug efflux pump subunit AcrB
MVFRIYMIFLLSAGLMCVNCREERTGCVSLIFDEHTVPPQGMIEDFKEEIEKIEYVYKAEILGLPEHVIDIVFDEEKVQAYGVDKEKAFRQIREQVPGRDNINALMDIEIETKDGYLIPLAQIACLEQRMEEHKLFYKGKRVYVINIEYDEKMREQLIDELEIFREWSWMEFVLDYECEDFYTQQTESIRY